MKNGNTKKFSIRKINKPFFAKILFISLFLFIGSQFFAFNASATCVRDTKCDYSAGEDIFNCKADCLGTGVPTKSPTEVLSDTTGWLIWFGVSICVIVIIIGGVYYVTSAGSEDRATTAKNMIKYAIIGLLVIGISYAIIVVIGDVFGP